MRAGGKIMLSFISACIVAIAIAYGGAILLDRYQMSVDHAFTTTGARI